MELSNFITDSLIQISNGIIGANQKMGQKEEQKCKAFCCALAQT